MSAFLANEQVGQVINEYSHLTQTHIYYAAICILVLDLADVCSLYLHKLIVLLQQRR